MNVFRLVADLSHLFAILILLFKIWKTRSCAGISGKSQLLFALVFTTRYLDLFTTYVSLYNSVMKILFIGSLYTTCYLIFVKFKATYNREEDIFRIELLVIPSAVLALLINPSFTPLEILWSFSIYLEAVAILPQLFMLQRRGEAETITAHYLFALGSYRALYLVNWIFRYWQEDYFDPIAVVAGIVQTVLFTDFFYIYFTRVVRENRKLELPI
ncbi:ER lumen protein-retaining receptor erd-2.2 [Aphelenchoides fujianensis]|nr:ER lumen protein-retaining receptor erd-2.2 [Aphelenchoides fujianensis]